MYFEFSDSEIADCSWDNGRLQLRFSAACIWNTEAARADDAVWAPLLLTAEQVEPWEAFEPSACLGRMRQGWVLYASEKLHQLPVPCAFNGVVTMEFVFAHGLTVHMRCQHLELQLLQGAVVGAYQC